MMNYFLVPLIGLAIFLAILLFAVWIWAIIDCVKSKSSGEYKLIWLLIIIFFNIIGAALYFLLANPNQERTFNFKNKKNEYLTRSSDNNMIAGVCGGLAEHFSFDPAIIRILWIVFTIFVNGVGVLLYIIAWIAIPLDKDVKRGDKKSGDKKETIQNDSKIKSSKQASKQVPNKKRKIFVTLMWVIIVFTLLISLIAGFIAIVGNLSYNNDFEQISVKNLVVDVRSEINEKIVVDEILKSHNYKNFNGHNLTLLEIKEPDDDSCILFERDPYGLKIYDSGCREFKYKFFVDSDTIKGYNVDVITSGGRILKMTYTSFASFENNTFDGDIFECLIEQRESDVCLTSYEPVCGFVEFPTDNVAGVTFSNECFACSNPEILYWVEGEC